jgi:4-amino-4-deoxy-L-arabinose transferase-like glycosyltransferase
VSVEAPQRPAFAHREVAAVAGVLGLVLFVFSGRYGYHRDELYFLEAGRHLTWGFPDQPPLVPALARLADLVAPDSLVVLRLPSTLSSVAVVLLSGLIARDLGARRSGQVVTAAATAMCGFVLGTGHLLSTSTFALLGGVLVTFLLQRLLVGAGGPWSWVLLGLVAGVAAEFNILVLALVAAAGIAVLVVGPRSLFREPGPYVAVVIALVLASPYLLWQADHGWPQFDIANNISNGGSGSSQSRLAFLPMVFLQVGPWLAPLWLAGLARLLRSTALRALGTAFLVLTVLVLVGGGKPYYLSGFLPLFLAAGAQPLLDKARRWVVPVLLLASTPVLVFVLPVLPVRDAQFAVDVNYDAGETIGWPAYVDQIARSYRTLPQQTRILTGNYGEAGAVLRYGPDRRLLRAYSGHNGFGRWGPPPASAPVLAVGVDPELLSQVCTAVRVVGRLHEVHGIENDEDGTALVFCASPIAPWAELWPRFTFVG